MAEQKTSVHDMSEHQRIYHNFVRGSIMLCLSCAFLLVALSAFAFGKTMSIFLGWLILVVGLIVVLIDLRIGSKHWLLSVATLVVFALITGINVT